MTGLPVASLATWIACSTSRGRAAIHAHRDDFRHIGGHRERVGERLPGARRRSGDRVATATPEHRAREPGRRAPRPRRRRAPSPAPARRLLRRPGSPAAAGASPPAARPTGRSGRRTPRRWPVPRRTARPTRPPTVRLAAAPRRGRPSPVRRCAATAASASFRGFRAQRTRRRTPDSSRSSRSKRPRGRMRSARRQSPPVRRPAAGPTRGRQTDRGRGPPIRSPGHRR